MEIQNISGPDIVQNNANASYDTSQETESSVRQTEVVDNESKGTQIDSYA